MKISGFTFIRNGEKFGYPFLQSIKSILPLCDEFIINYSKSDDRTLKLLKSIKNKKIKIIETKWDNNLRKSGKILAKQTNISLSFCKGEWCFYLQSDEVVHEKYLPEIKEKLKRHLYNNKVEGFLFNYFHFYGSYNTYFDKRPFYRKEIRIVKNNIGVKSYKDAQGFRIDNRKLNVIQLNAYIYHYGWVKSENIMIEKQKNLDRYWHNDEWIAEKYRDKDINIFSQIEGLKFFSGIHPKVMFPLIKKYKSNFNPDPKDTKIKSFFKRIRNFIEDKILKMRLGEYRNYKIIRL